MSGTKPNFRTGDPGVEPNLATLMSYDNIFVALMPPEAVIRQATRIADTLRHRYDLDGRLRPLHVTLFNPIEKTPWPETIIPSVIEAMDILHFDLFPIVLDQVMSFKVREGWAIVLVSSRRNDLLLDAQRKTMEVFRHPGLELGRKQAFTPHMTLFYSHREIGRQMLEAEVRWTTSEAYLIRSLVGQTKYIQLWPRLDRPHDH
jgi:2'-5' RNA ligase